MEIIIINGPNLNLLGRREPTIYGDVSFEEYLEHLRTAYSPICNISYYQSNHEGDIVDKIQETGFTFDGIILNAAAYSHSSIAIHDAIKAVNTPVIEVHITNVHAREEFRRHSFISPACKGNITGLGLDSYRLALEFFINV